MRVTAHHVWLPALALLAVACAPCHRHHGGMMMGGCGPGSCGYKSECFSDGAARSNDGVCQACSGGKWVPATGCREHEHHECGMKGGKSAPCDREHHRKASPK